jgi:hypothetical protein
MLQRVTPVRYADMLQRRNGTGATIIHAMSRILKLLLSDALSTRAIIFSGR